MLALSATLLCWDLGQWCFWGDELNTIDLARCSVPELLDHADVYPPFYFLIVHFWIGLFGESEVSYRLISALPGIAAVAVVYALGREARDERLGLLAAGLLAMSPFAVLFVRMGRYYAWSMFLTTASTWLFLRWLRTARWRDAGIYWLASLLLLYTHYLPAVTLLWQNLHMLAHARRYRSRSIVWIGLQASLFVAFLPWLGRIFTQTGHYTGYSPAELSTGLRGILVKVGYTAYAFILGETVFPWRWGITIPAGLAGLALWLRGAAWAWRQGPGPRFWLAATLLSIGATVAITATVARFEQTSHVPCLLLFIYPMFLLTLAAGGLAFWDQHRRWRRLVVGGSCCVLGLSWLLGLSNYFTGRDLHNPQWDIPWREVVAHIRQEHRSGDLFVHAEGQLSIYGPDLTPSPGVWMAESAWQRGERWPRVWTILRDRGQRELVEAVEVFESKLIQEYRMIDERGFAPISVSEQRYKSRLLGRPVLPYNVRVRLYERMLPP
ncbi:MAG: glycosyltransferase family 39 protein [Planctomycetes bacterium]|nr:glycosyltransferase family 39 protein [Planctomycetota bacterium]